MDSLQQYLKHSSLVNGEYTHVSLGRNKGSWYIEDTENFLKAYSSVFLKKQLCIAEKPNDFIPLIADIDLKIKEDEGLDFVTQKQQLYGLPDVEKVISIFHKVIKIHVNRQPCGYQKFALTTKQLWCMLLEKPPYVKDGYYKNGFHLHFPHLFISKQDSKVLTESVQSYLEPINNFDKNYLDIVSSKCWLLYGSSKEESLEPYRISTIYNQDLKSISLQACFASEVSDLRSITETDLPKLLSICSINQSDKIFSLKKNVFETPSSTRLLEEFKNYSTDLTFVKKIVTCIDLKRADDYQEWAKIGQALFNTDETEQSLNIWKDFSSQSEKYDEAICESYWIDFGKRAKRENCITLGSLIFMAKQDNLNLFLELIKKVNINYIPTTDSKIIDEFLKHNTSSYICGLQGWFRFNGTIWRYIENIGSYIRKDFVSFSELYSNELKKIQEDDEDDEEEKNKSNTTKAVKSLNKKCENYSSQNNLIKMLSDYLWIENLNSLLNSKPNLIAFKNGIYDLDTFTFRIGKKDDYISKSLNVNYNTHLTMDSEEVKNLEKFLIKIFPDPEIYNYFMMQVSEAFYGGNRDKIIMIWTGKGNNGKSVIQSLFEKMFSKLAIKLPASAILGLPKAGGCLPEISRVEGGIRWVVIDELEADAKLKAGILKLLSGNDTLYARDILQKGKDMIEITPFFNLILICNTIPKIYNGEKATFNRIRVIPFESKFRDDIDKDLPESYMFKEDKNMSSKLGTYVEVFAWYLIEKLKEKVTLPELTIPLKVNEATTKYKSQCDVIALFISEHFNYNPQDKSYIKVSFYYKQFREWYRTEYSTNSIFSNQDFSTLFIEHANGDEKSGTVQGYSVKELFEE